MTPPMQGRTWKTHVAAVSNMTDREKLDMILQAYNDWLEDYGDDAESNLRWPIEAVILAEAEPRLPMGETT